MDPEQCLEKIKVRLQIVYFSTGIIERCINISIPSLLTGGVVIMTAIFWEAFTRLHWTIQIAFYLSLFMFLFGLSGLAIPSLVKWWRRKHAIYFTRKSMPDIESRLAIADRVWAMAYNAETFRKKRTLTDLKKPQELIILDPDGDYLKFHESFFENSMEQTKTGIVAILNTPPADIKIGKYDGAMPFSMLIMNPESSHSKIQLEIPIPGLEEERRPIILINKENDPDLYNALLDFYKRTRTKIGMD